MSILVEAKHVTRNYHGNPVVNDVSFQISQGECVVIVGPSGAGKSTLLRCIAGIDEIADGEVIYREEAYSTPQGVLRNLQGDIGMVFQQFNLFPHLTSIENVMLGPRRVKHQKASTVRQQAEDLLAKVGLADRMDYYPEELSGGQQQRVAIARALAMQPSLMLFDEPTSSLDPEYTREVLEVMKAVIATGMTVAIVTHEMGFARQSADRVVFMDAGAIIEIAPTEQFFTSPETARAKKFVEQSGES